MNRQQLIESIEEVYKDMEANPDEWTECALTLADLVVDILYHLRNS